MLAYYKDLQFTFTYCQRKLERSYFYVPVAICHVKVLLENLNIPKTIDKRLVPMHLYLQKSSKTMPFEYWPQIISAYKVN